jgi:hypothetical protein
MIVPVYQVDEVRAFGLGSLSSLIMAVIIGDEIHVVEPVKGSDRGRNGSESAEIGPQTAEPRRVGIQPFTSGPWSVPG